MCLSIFTPPPHFSSTNIYLYSSQLLKNRHRLLAKQKESEVKQSSWQAFAGGKGKKRVKGTLKGLRKVSIFKSPEVGGKVGVVGSGQGTTAYDSKKRYKLN